MQVEYVYYTALIFDNCNLKWRLVLFLCQLLTCKRQYATRIQNSRHLDFQKNHFDLMQLVNFVQQTAKSSRGMTELSYPSYLVNGSEKLHNYLLLGFELT